MKTTGRLIWLAFVVAIIVIVVAFNLEAARLFFNSLLVFFVRMSLLCKILVGFIVWLALVIIPFIAFIFVVGEPEEGPGIYVLLFFALIWPPAWPIAIVLWILIKKLSKVRYTNRRNKS